MLKKINSWLNLLVQHLAGYGHVAQHHSFGLPQENAEVGTNEEWESVG